MTFARIDAGFWNGCQQLNPGQNEMLNLWIRMRTHRLVTIVCSVSTSALQSTPCSPNWEARRPSAFHAREQQANTANSATPGPQTSEPPTLLGWKWYLRMELCPQQTQPDLYRSAKHMLRSYGSIRVARLRTQ